MGIKYQSGYGSMFGKGASRVFGVPGFTPGQPGWAGRAGVAQVDLGRGLNHGSRPVQTYGSLGYGSMGNGSMDMSIRAFSGTEPIKRAKKKPASKPRPAFGWGKPAKKI